MTKLILKHEDRNRGILFYIRKIYSYSTIIGIYGESKKSFKYKLNNGKLNLNIKDIPSIVTSKIYVLNNGDSIETKIILDGGIISYQVLRNGIELKKQLRKTAKDEWYDTHEDFYVIFHNYKNKNRFAYEIIMNEK